MGVFHPGGALLGDVDKETGVFKLAVPLGHAPTTGMGLVLNGGFGTVGRVLGPTSDRITSVQIVTASAEVVRNFTCRLTGEFYD